MPDCPRCGAELGSGEAAGLCPRCLIAGALGSSGSDVVWTETMGPAASGRGRGLRPLSDHPVAGPRRDGHRLSRRAARTDSPAGGAQGREARAGHSQVLARFSNERQALALMDHPNIAQIFDAGASSGTSLLRDGVHRRGTHHCVLRSRADDDAGGGWRCFSRSAAASSMPTRRA